jgi:nucleotide-binding universal stress UspA family protein
MTYPVAVGIDGSPQSTAAARWGAREALRRGLPLLLVHAWRVLPAAAGMPGVGIGLVEDDARALLEAARDDVRSVYPDLAVDTLPLTYDDRDGLVALSGKASLLVLGSRGLGGFTGLLVGSTGLDTAARSHCPVVLVRAGEGSVDEYRRVDGDPVGALQPRPVLLGLDARHPSGTLLEFALRTAEQRGAELQVVHAWSLPPLWSVNPVYLPDSERARIHDEQVALLDTALRGWEQKFPTVTVHRTVAFGGAAEVLVREAEQAALVVVGRQLHRSTWGPHLGPAAHAVMHHAACPVAVVPHG